MENRDKYLAKIKKILNLAKNSTNEHEAANAIKQAQNLMDYYNHNKIDIELIDIEECRSHGAPSNAKKVPEYTVSLANMICNAFGVSCYYSYTDSRRVVAFYGYHERPKIAAYGFDVLSRQLVKARSEFISSQRKNIKRSTKTNRADQYCEGWVSGARKVISNFSIDESEKKLLSVFYERLAIEKGFITFEPRGAKACRGDEVARSAGYQAGQEATLHQAVSGHRDSLKTVGFHSRTTE